MVVSVLDFQIRTVPTFPERTPKETMSIPAPALAAFVRAAHVREWPHE
jgi:hypothetical protein